MSRNPIYAGEAIVWLGWALFYRRPPVWAGLAIGCAAFARIARSEEQRLPTPISSLSAKLTRLCRV